MTLDEKDLGGSHQRSSNPSLFDDPSRDHDPMDYASPIPMKDIQLFNEGE